MPWLETSPVEQRERFIRDHRAGLYMMTELCARYDVSRKTGYKWLERFMRPAAEACRIGAGRRTIVPTGSRRRSRP
jgi:transposase